MSNEICEAKYAKEYIDKLVNKINSLQETIDNLTGKIIPVNPYTFGRVMASVYSYNNPKKARNEVEKLYQENIKIRDENKPAYENNLKVYSAIMNILKNAGIKEQYFDYPSSKARQKKWIDYHWKSEIRSQISTIDYFENTVENVYKRKIKEIEEWEKKIEQENIQKQRELEKQQKDIEKKKVIAVMTVKYNLDIMSEAEDILYGLLNKNKYLHLAHYLEKNRGDWSDGYDYAEMGLSQFEIENSLDQKIYNNINNCIENWCCDGRVFRDCEYSYDILFDMVSKQDNELYNDYCKVKEYID